MTLSYPPIGSLGAVGDGQSLALVDGDGGIQWYCPLRFDADPVVWPLVDHHRGGGLRVGPIDPVRCRVSYLEGTAVLCYEWETATGRVQAQVGLVWPSRGGQHLVWVVDGLEGRADLRVLVDPRPGWGHHEVVARHHEVGVEIVMPDRTLVLAAPVHLRTAAPGVVGAGVIEAGERVVCCLHADAGDHAGLAGADPDAVARALDETVAAWRRWSGGLRYDGPWREAVLRSAITLKLLIYEPSGTVVAAGTTSLPEDPGGVRNWDYRYTWLRDASFTLNALYQLGFRREASRYAAWMCRTTAAHGLPLRVLYGVDGETHFPEVELDELEGYRGSRPVRVGNGAEHQHQLDSGELLDCLTICEVLGDEVMRREWGHFRRLVDFVANHWREPDSGIWEVRDRPRHFVHSKAMAWTALDRGCRLVEAFGLPGDLERWCQEADALRAEVGRHGVAGGHFVRAYGEDSLDASLLTLPVVGFVEGDDPVMAATIDAVRAGLTPPGTVRGGLLYRYRPEAGDGLPGQEGAFAICSFWLVEALTLAGRRAEAEELFAGILSLAGDLGLFAEEIDPATGEQLGNTPTPRPSPTSASSTPPCASPARA